jgi:hypothetical protein
MQLTKEDLLKECLLTHKQAAEFLSVKEYMLAFVGARTENIELPDGV